MPTAKHRIAAYLPLEVDEKFQAFKEERGVGDSQALVLILTEFLEVSYKVKEGSSLDIVTLKSELLSKLLSELDNKFSELKSELLSELPKSVGITHESLKDVKLTHDSLVDVKVTHERLKPIELGNGFVERPTIAQLSIRFGCDAALIRKQKSKYKDDLEKFVVWSKSRDPDGCGWKFNDSDRVFDRVN